MPTIPWRSTASRDTGAVRPGNAAVVQLSRLELRQMRSVPGFMLAALRLRREVLRSDGALGMSLKAHPLRRTFWTLSAWSDTDALGAFTRSESHRAVMKRYRNQMNGSHFHTWFPGEASTHPSWSDAMARLEEVDADRSGGSETVPHR